MANTTEADEAEAESRLEQCEMCPPRGGACAGSNRAGKGPVWRDGIKWGVCTRWRTYRIDERMRDAGFPSKLLVRSFENYEAENVLQEEALQTVRAWVETFEDSSRTGEGLLLCGDTGIGKTHLAVAACRELFVRHRIERPRFWDMVHLLGVFRRGGEKAEQAIESAMSADVLVLDDLNTYRVTEWAAESIGLIVNHRWSNNLPSIVTTNDDLAAYEEMLGKRTVSRLNECLIPISWTGRDYRVDG